MEIGYARVSTLVQTLDLQTDALNLAGCELIFSDTVSGAKTERKGLADAFSHLRVGDTLVVWRLDRLGRTLPHLIQTVQELKAKGIGFKSLAESIDTTSSAGQLSFHIFGALAEVERNLIRERTQAGLIAARARGRVGGRRRLLDAKQVAQARTLYADTSNSVGDICRTLKVSRTTLWRYLKMSVAPAPLRYQHQ